MANYMFNRVTTVPPKTAERSAAGLAPPVSDPFPLRPMATRLPLPGRKRLLPIFGGLALVLAVAWGLTTRRSANLDTASPTCAETTDQAAVSTASGRPADFLRTVRGHSLTESIQNRPRSSPRRQGP